MSSRQPVEGSIEGPFGRTWYGVHGSDAPGVPLLVLHGGPGAPHDYLEPLTALCDQRPVVFYDQLGCGNSDRSDDLASMSLDYFMDELVRLRTHLKLDALHLLGQSWGCMLAVDYLLEKKPSGVRSVIFSGPCLSTSRFVADLRRYLADLPAAMQEVVRHCEQTGNFDLPAYEEAMTAFYRRHVCRLDPWPDCMARTMEKFGTAVYHRMWGFSEFSMTGTLKDYDRTDRLRELALPALFTCGQFDEATPETTAWYHSLLPGSELVVFEDASHEHHLERPQEYCAVVRAFLDRM